MPSIREFYFNYINKIEESKYISRPQFLHLLCKYCGFTSETELTLHFDDDMKDANEVSSILEKVFKGKMLEYLINESYFYGRYFYVDKNVLIPRQETEELLSYFFSYIKKLNLKTEELTIADICTGSGCLAVSISKECSVNKIYATDISYEALKVARKNNEKFGADVEFLLGDICNPLIENGIKVDCVICNPPYIKDSSSIDERTWEQEPHLALLSDPDTFFYENILLNAYKFVNDKHLIAFEIGEEMKDPLDAIATKYLPNDKIDFIKDMDGKWRFMIIYSDGSEMCLKAARSLENHGVIAFPTETVMGLGVAYDDEIAFNKLNKVKGRPENKPYTLMLGDKNEISKYAYISDDEQKVIDKFLPGPLTILLRKKDLPHWVTLDSEYVGIRVPDLPVITNFLNNFGKPVLAPSANKSGEKPALNSNEVGDIFKNELDFIIPGEASNGLPSTIVIINNGVKILRQGKITKEDIEEVLK